MKGSSIATVVLVAIVSTVAAALIVNAVLGDPNEEVVTVQYMEVIAPMVTTPDVEVFNAEAVNPTVEVYVGDCKAGQTWDADLQKCVEIESSGDDSGDSGEE